MDSNQTSSFWKVPAHITGLFQIVKHKDMLQMGSKGAGFSINNYIITKIQYSQESIPSKNEVFYNNKKINGIVTKTVVKEFEEHLNKKSLTINHYSLLPIEGGFGTSGAGALGTAFALAELLQTNYSRDELGQIAHKAEVKCQTGLGDVIAQLYGKPEIRINPGAPTIGKIKPLIWPEEQLVLSIFLGTSSTKDIITSEKMYKNINRAASKLLPVLEKDPTVGTFLNVSFLFAKEAKLMPRNVAKMIKKLRAWGYSASMVMLGKAVFVVGTEGELINCQEQINKHFTIKQSWINPVAREGPSIASPEIISEIKSYR
ncbi:hypothetical protein EU523_01330 [Candidatus Heimdallarchaeota archaeon]|nr:MAG: hypothetical protein EU523_01330 [Candidatus Heimdallarchaeota archaeon]